MASRKERKVSAKRTINVSLEKGTRMMVEYVDRDGNRHTFKFGRKPDGSYVETTVSSTCTSSQRMVTSPSSSCVSRTRTRSRVPGLPLGGLPRTRRSTGRRSLLTSPGRLPPRVGDERVALFLVAAACCVTDVASANVAGTGDWNQATRLLLAQSCVAEAGFDSAQTGECAAIAWFTSSAFTR